MNIFEISFDFCHVFIHNLLYYCQIYPEYLFESRNFYGIIVKQCRHPQINGYIDRVLNNAKPLLYQVLFWEILLSINFQLFCLLDVLFSCVFCYFCLEIS
jgi:hypothetical protein